MTVLSGVLQGVLLLGAGTIFLARLLDTLGAGRAPNPVPQLAAFAPWAIPVWAFLVLLGVATGDGAVVLVAAAALAVQVIWAVPPGRPGPVPDVVPGRPITLVSVNALMGRVDQAALLELAGRVEADLLVVQELTARLADDLDPRVRGAGLAYAQLHPAQGGAGTGIWSRWPFAVLGLLDSSRCAIPQVRVQPPAALPVTVTSVHTQAPNPRLIHGWRADLAMLARTVRTTAGTQILAGDFNASRDHAGFRQILQAGVADAADLAGGPWPGFTWPSSMLPLADRRSLVLTRLDHVLVGPDVTVRSLETVRLAGTDHRAVVARLVVPGR